MKERTRYLFLATFFLSLTVQPLSAASYENIITESFLRNTFDFKSGEAIKYAECKKKSYPTCTYVWGKVSKKDAKRKQYGLAPMGNKLMVIYAQAKKQTDFERVFKVYKDAVALEGFGEKAVWSKQRGQLSLITKKHLIIHVNVEGIACNDPLLKAKTVAKSVLNNL